MHRSPIVRQQRRLTAYLSDVEGSTHYWNKYLSISRVLCRCPTTREVKFRQDDCHQEGVGVPSGDSRSGGGTASLQTAFVYGGDAFDKGGDDLDFVRDLIQLKRRYGDRVTLLAGNRDVNKMNFRSFFTPSYIESLGRPDTIPLPFFMQGYAHATTYAQFLERCGLPTDRTTRLSYFRWRLECTMGSQGLFEMRRAYLAGLRAGSGPVTDEDVMHSFLDSAEPGGVVHEFLPLTRLAAVLDGVLFVHGAVTKESAGFVPSLTLREAPVARSDDVPGAHLFQQGASVAEWVEALNKFHCDNIAAWNASPEVDLRTGVRGGGSLAAYCHRASTKGKTVVVQSFIERSSPKKPAGGATPCDRGAPFEPTFLDLNIVEHLNHSGVFRICCGHKPVGDIPLSMQQPGLSVHVVDNSYCGLAAKCGGVDGRGEAVQEVLLDGAAGTAIAHGRRTDGAPFEYSLDHPIVGVPLGDGWWTKAVLPTVSSSTSTLSSSATSGGEANLAVLAHRTFDDYFNIEHRTIPLDEVERIVVENPVTMLPTLNSRDHDASEPMMFPRYSTEELTRSRRANARIKTKKVAPTAVPSDESTISDSECKTTAGS